MGILHRRRYTRMFHELHDGSEINSSECGFDGFYWQSTIDEHMSLMRLRDALKSFLGFFVYRDVANFAVFRVVPPENSVRNAILAVSGCVNQYLTINDLSDRIVPVFGEIELHPA